MLTGLLFQLPGLIIMTLVGVGAASFLKNPAPWLRGATAGLGAAGVADPAHALLRASARRVYCPSQLIAGAAAATDSTASGAAAAAFEHCE